MSEVSLKCAGADNNAPHRFTLHFFSTSAGVGVWINLRPRIIVDDITDAVITLKLKRERGDNTLSGPAHINQKSVKVI